MEDRMSRERTPDQKSTEANTPVWAHHVSPESVMSTRIEAERHYQEVCKMSRQETGAGQEVPF
jgi:hypothetical protein